MKISLVNDQTVHINLILEYIDLSLKIKAKSTNTSAFSIQNQKVDFYFKTNLLIAMPIREPRSERTLLNRTYI